MTTSGPEPLWQRTIRVVLGWGSGGWILFGPLPYAIPWWGRLVVAFLLISIAHSTVTGIVLRNVAASAPTIMGLVRGVVANRRGPEQLGTGTQEELPKRRKSDARGKRP